MLGDLWVSTRGQDYGVEVQRAAVASEAERIADHGETGKNADRLGLIHALARPDAGEADALIVSKLDRLSRLAVDFGGILRAETQPRRGRKPLGPIALDVDVDMITPTGRMMAHTLIAIAEWEGGTISEQKRAALAVAKRDHGRASDPDSLIRLHVFRIVQRARSQGLTFRAIAASLNSARISSKRREVWQVPSVQRTFRTADSAKRKRTRYMRTVWSRVSLQSVMNLVCLKA